MGVLFFVLLFFPFLSFSAVITSNASGDWNVGATWVGGVAPGAGDDAIIASPHTVNVTVNADCINLTVNSGGTLNFNNNVTLTVSANAVVSGTVTMINGKITNLNIAGNLIMNAATLNLNDNNSTVNLTGTCTNNSGLSTITGPAGTKGNFLMSSSLSLTAGTTLSVDAVDFWELNITTTTIDGTFLFAGSASGRKIFRGDITISATGTWNDAIGEDPELNGNIVNNGSLIGCTGGTCTYTFGKQIPGSYTLSGNPFAFSNLKVQGGTTVTNLGTVILDGIGNNVLKQGGGGVATFNNGDGVALAVLYLQNGNTDGVQIPGAGNIIFNASFVNNTVHYSRGGAQNIRIPDDNCYYNLVCESSGTKIFQAPGTIGIKNLLTIKDNAIVDVGTNTLADGCGGSAALTMNNNSQLLIAKCGTVPEFSGTYTLTGGTIVLNGICAQTLHPNICTANNITFDKAGAGAVCKEFGCCGILINGTFSILNNAQLCGACGFTMSCTGTFDYSSGVASTLGGNISVGNFSQTAGTLNDGGFNITVCGSSWARSAGTFTATGRVIFNGSTTVSGIQTNFNNVTINAGKTLVGPLAANMGIGVAGAADWTNNGTFTHNGGIVTALGSTTVQGSSITTFNHLTISAGTLTGHATEMIMQGNWTNNSAFTHNGGKVTFTGGNAQSLAGTAATAFFNLEVTKTAGTILTQTAATAAVNNLLTMTEGIFIVGVNTLNGAGGFMATGGDLRLAKLATVPELTGAYSITGGTVTLNGAGAQTLGTSAAGANTYYNLVFSVSGAKTITGLLFINGDVTVSGISTLTAFSAFTQASAKTFNYNSTGVTSVTAGVPIIVGNYSQTAGTFALPANAGNILTVTGVVAAWNKTGGTFTNTTPSVVKFNGSSAQTFTDNGTIFSNVTMDNVNGLFLNSNLSFTGPVLTFINGTITTGGYYVYGTTSGAGVAGAGTGKFVNGNFRRAVGFGTYNFQIGTGTDYTPVNITFNAGNTCSDLTCSSTAGDNPNIFASTINASKTVNRYWTLTNNAGTPDYSARFNWVPTDPDVAFNWTTDTVERYNGTIWNGTTISTRTSSYVIISGATTPALGSSESFQVGNDYNATSFWNRVTGGGNLWSILDTWIQDRRGGITTSTLSTAVTGCGTQFTTELNVGDIIMSQVDPTTIIGTVASIGSPTTLTLTSTAGADNTCQSYGREKVPDVNDEVNIGNLNLPGAPVTVVVDIPTAVCNLLTFTTMGQGNTLSHNTGSVLNVQTSVYVNQPGNANTNAWNINDGIVTANGNVRIGSNDASAGRFARVYLTTGTLNIGTNLLYSTTAAVNAVLDLTGGAGIVNLSGQFLLSSAGTLSTAGTENIFNYNGAFAQTVTFGSSIAYRNLYLNNTDIALGATLGAAVTTSNVTGDIRTGTLTGSALFRNGGFAIAGTAGRKFEVANSATFRMTGTAAFPTGYSIVTADYIFGPTSTTQYWQTNAQAVSAVGTPGYGRLYCQPSVSAVIQTMPAAVVNVQSNLVIGNGTNTGTLAGTATSTLNVLGSITINPSGTFNAANVNTFCAGDWTNNGTFTPGIRTVTFNGGVAQAISAALTPQTFYDVTVDKGGGTLSTSVATINTNNITLAVTNVGTFTAPATLTLNGAAPLGSTLTLSGGIFNAGSIINIRGNWTNNGGTFNPNGGLVRFNGSDAAIQYISGTAASQTFYDVEVNKTNGSVRMLSPTTTVTMNNYLQTLGPFASSTVGATVNVNGNFTLTSGTYNNVINPGTGISTLNIGGNITHNSINTWSMSNQVTLNGSAPQTISGIQIIPNFTNLTINNTYPATAVTLNKPITVNGIFTLTDGHLLTDATNILTLGTAATVAYICACPIPPVASQDSSYVKGFMQHTYNVSASSVTKDYPVGAANADNHMHLAKLTIRQSSTTATTYPARYIVSSAMGLGWSLPASIDYVSYSGYWDITKNAGAGVTSASVDLYYIQWDGVADPANLTVAKGDPTAWIDIGGPGNTAPSGDIISTTNFTTFSYFSLANKIGGLNPLPVELLSFDAKPNGNIVDVTWSTASELNSDYFMVQRSKDGTVFEDVIEINAAENSSTTKNYSASDYEPYNGTSYYRLKQVDNDGKFTYSDLVAVNFHGDDVIAVYPNPTHGSFNVSIKANAGDEVLIVVRDLLGREFYSKVIILANDKEVIAIDPSGNIAAGIYLVVATSNDNIYEKKIVIK